MEEVADQKPSHEKTPMDLEIVSIIDAAILRLPQACQRVVQEYLNFKMGLYESYEELSRVLKINVPIPCDFRSLR